MGRLRLRYMLELLSRDARAEKAMLIYPGAIELCEKCVGENLSVEFDSNDSYSSKGPWPQMIR